MRKTNTHTRLTIGDNDKINDIRERSLNNTILLITLISGIPLILVFVREDNTNNFIYPISQLITFFILIIITALKNNLSYKIKAIGFVSAIIISGLLSVFNNGIYGIGIGMIVIGNMFTAFYFDRKTAIYSGIASIGILITIMFLHIVFSFNIYNETYINNSPYSWINTIVLSTLLFSLYLYNQNLLLNSLSTSIDALNKRTEELLQSNQKLSTEIFERKKSEIALKINEEKFRAMFDEANDTILIVADNYIINCNKQAEILFKTNRKKIIGKSIAEISPKYQPDGELSADKANSIISNTIQNGSRRFEWIHKTYHGNNVETEVSLKQIKIGDKTVLQAIIRDISIRKKYERELELHKNNLEKLVKQRTQEIEKINEELKATNESLNFTNNLLEKENKIRELAEEELLQYQSDLRESNAAKDKLFSIIGHDLKNPFHLIINFTELLNGKMGEYSEQKKQKFIDYIGDTAKQGYELLKNLLSWARSQTNTIAFEPQKINIKKVLKEIFTLMQPAATEKQITLTSHITSDTFVYADIEMIKTVIRNIISNSIKFTESKGEIQISAKHGNSYFKIEIKDNGVGMTEEQQKGLFEIRKNKSTQGTSGEEGTGLGLILCKEFVEKNNGKIWVESQLGRGSSFFFTIPEYSIYSNQLEVKD